MRPESGQRAWLRFQRLRPRGAPDKKAKEEWGLALADVRLRCPSSDSPVAITARDELVASAKVLMGVVAQVRLEEAAARVGGRVPWTPQHDACERSVDPKTGGLILEAASPQGLLFGCFSLLESVALLQPPLSGHRPFQPAKGLRMLDHWDNADGTIERGYAGKSLFFRNGRPVTSRRDLGRIDQYARLLASIGINAVALNNVNVHAPETALIREPHLGAVAAIAGVFRKWGVRVFLSVNYASPIELDGHKTADPLDRGVAEFWAQAAARIWDRIPDFGGFLVKADSEGRPGPFTYGRTHADGANMLARAVAGRGGLVLWRCFVYNCQQDWRDRKTDRARAAYDHFVPLDGKFDDNVILQIKNGPMDFQVREPVSPLLGGLRSTKQALELQITQEYTGQQKHACCLIPQWSQILRFGIRAESSVADAVHAITAVANVGDEDNWTGHHLAQANLYGFGALAWAPDESPSSVIARWRHLTWGDHKAVAAVVDALLEQSWPAYEDYTSPLGVGWMVNPNHHYGPNVDGYEYSRWGTYHFADRDGIGVDRTQATGTGYSGQYHAGLSPIFEDRSKCPDELLLFFHHVDWTHRLHSGKTVIQHIYDSHFRGVEWCERTLEAWNTLKAQVDARRHQEVAERLELQLASAREWRDQVNTYCFRKSGRPDEHGRTIF